VTLPAQGSMDRVFSEEMERKLLEHPGKWVGLYNDEIVAVGNSPAETLSLAKKAGYSPVLLHHVPEQGKAYFF
jgi:hypothetical protein